MIRHDCPTCGCNEVDEGPTVPEHSVELCALSDDPVNPTEAIQYSVMDPNGRGHIYGDQKWVAYGRCIEDGSHPDGRIQYRTITLTYGDWQDA